ncbi:MAG: GNAT family N-acetyltransferase [Chitinophagaceae bacterium]|nr:GNAT family N-acetyltransferase [Chitinophagaceae bacterium]
MKHRLAIEKDIDFVYDLYMDEVSNPYLTYDPMSKKEFENIYYELLPENTLYIVEIDDRVIASYRLIPKKDRQAHIFYIGGFVVNHAMKGKGFGSKILSHIKDFATKHGKKRIELTVDIENEPAIKLYSKIGFMIEGRIRNSYKRSTTNKYYDEYFMGLTL